MSEKLQKGKFVETWNVSNWIMATIRKDLKFSKNFNSALIEKYSINLFYVIQITSKLVIKL